MMSDNGGVYERDSLNRSSLDLNEISPECLGLRLEDELPARATIKRCRRSRKFHKMKFYSRLISKRF